MMQSKRQAVLIIGLLILPLILAPISDAIVFNIRPSPNVIFTAPIIKTCTKHQMPACPGGRIVIGRIGSDGCFGPSVCVYPKLPGTCERRCGWTSGAGRCRCDIQCTKRGDCCTDYIYLCSPKKCPTVYDPVCSKNGKTYGNTCLAEDALAKIACRGKCPCKMACPIYKEPPCLEGTVVAGKKLSNGCDGPPICKMPSKIV